MSIKFITLNLWRGGLLFDGIIKFIKKENPDILALQEVNNGNDHHRKKNEQTLTIFQRQFDYYHCFFSPAFSDQRKNGAIPNGNAVFSRYPIVSGQTIFYDVPFTRLKIDRCSNYSRVPRNLQQTVIHTNDTNLYVYNTQGIWGQDGNDNPRRLEMGRMIVNEIKNKHPLILAGDFNVSPNTKTIGSIEQHLYNVFGNKLTTTFNMQRKNHGGYATAIVDMVFVSHDIRVLSQHCPMADISDHLPLICLLELNSKFR
ncbi:endonuclease/exonuclease/phosphatase family protein [Patescibacteria group bacterium]|nr:endonuclease/exonuclease/phosphatase family protein [Patescibacteria group bacterium]